MHDYLSMTDSLVVCSLIVSPSASEIGFGMGATSGHISKVIEALGASGRIFYLLDRIPAIPKPLSKADSSIVPTKPAIEGAVKFSSVSFAYPARPDIQVLNEFSLSVPPNTTAALVGSSGSGKSTVVALLQRFYDTDSGSIEIDGHDIKDVDLAWLRSHIGYVQQEPQLFGVSIRDNLMVSQPSFVVLPTPVMF
jgi:ATP-binding cassette subfamily B (MDR/TAP) protein 1